MPVVTLEDILNCPTLPSLPAVAVKVIELTSDDDVSLDELAQTIQNDQGLASKVLRTVNSSFYGLRQRCATIERALVMLGLGPVKSLALGFSLVQTVDGSATDGFDLISYWRRGLYCAVAAKSFADAAKLDCGDEAFLGALLQDVGMIAMNTALGTDYAKLTQETEKDHRELVARELRDFELQHPDVGAMLCKKWKLPDELLIPVKFHERPTAAPPSCVELVRLVGLGGYAYEALTVDEPQAAMRQLYKRAQQWFRMDESRVDEVMRGVAEDVKEASKLFGLDTGEPVDADQVLLQAQRQMIEVSRANAAQAPSLMGLDEVAGAITTTDPLTGLLAKDAFTSALVASFEACEQSGDPIAVIAIAVEGVEAIVKRFEEECALEIALGVGTLMRKHFEPMGGVVARLSRNVFAAVVRSVDHKEAQAACKRFKSDFDRHPEVWVPTEASSDVHLSVSIGTADTLPSDSLITRAEMLLAAATHAVKEARAAGGGCIRTYAPKRKAA
ncbi:MAG: HDOD domain-containing protein [Planctomycetota bacterium]